MGANIGTTITAQIVALGNFDITMYAMVLSAIGAFMNMLSKNDKVKTIGLLLAGLGFVFIGLNLMKMGMSPIINDSSIQSFICGLKNPFLLLLIGIIITAIIQSSSAVTSIIIVMVSVSSSAFVGNSALYLILGSNIGTCITALLSSIGANANAKRAAVIHLLFNVFGALIFFIILLIFPNFNKVLFKNIFHNPSTEIAMFHTFFNIVATILFLPFIKVFVHLSEIFVKDKKVKKIATTLDERFLKTPSIAIDQATNETIRYAHITMDILNNSINGFLNKDDTMSKKIKESITLSEELNQSILNYLLKISATDISVKDGKYVSGLHRVLIDLSREAELADNFIKYTSKVVSDDINFSPLAMEGIEKMRDLLNLQFKNVENAFVKNKKIDLNQVEKIEDNIDKLRSKIISLHIERLEQGLCSPNMNSIFISLISNLERAGDHLEYAIQTLNDCRKG